MKSFPDAFILWADINITTLFLWRLSQIQRKVESPVPGSSVSGLFPQIYQRDLTPPDHLESLVVKMVKWSG